MERCIICGELIESEEDEKFDEYEIYGQGYCHIDCYEDAEESRL